MRFSPAHRNGVIIQNQPKGSLLLLGLHHMMAQNGKFFFYTVSLYPLDIKNLRLAALPAEGLNVQSPATGVGLPMDALGGIAGLVGAESGKILSSGGAAGFAHTCCGLRFSRDNATSQGLRVDKT